MLGDIIATGYAVLSYALAGVAIVFAIDMLKKK